MNLKSDPRKLPSDHPLISIIIPFYGDKKDLENCLTGIQRQNFSEPYEIIVVESGGESVAKQLINFFPEVTFISSNSILYPGKARNIGVKNSTADLLAFIDADSYPDTNWLSEISKTLKKGVRGVIGPILNLYPFHPIASVDNLLQFPDFQKHRSPYNISHFPACNLGISKESFLKSGDFPEDFVTGEDIIFSRNFLKHNEGKVVFNSRLIVKHSGRRYIKSFIKHNNDLGFHRGYLKLKLSPTGNRFRGSLLYSFLFGLKRLAYISVRTLQWNSAGVLRIIVYFPILVIGLTAWIKGFWKGNKKYYEEKKWDSK